MVAKRAAPEGAGDVLDAKALEDELKALMKELITERDDARQHVTNIFVAEQKHQEARRGLDAVLQERKLLINKSGQVSKQPDPQEIFDMSGIDTAKLLADAEAAVAKKNPLEPIVNKFAELGYDTEGAFEMLDEDGDGALTRKEIEDGMAFHKIILSPDEWTAFWNAIDANSDGVLDLDEWQSILEPQVNAQTGYMAIMGNVNISDPLVLEERNLDLQYRNRHLEKELHVLRSQSGGADSLKAKQKALKKQILAAEAQDQEKIDKAKAEEAALEQEMRAELLQKDQIQQEFQALTREKEQSELEYSMRLDEIHKNLNMLDKKHFDMSQYNIAYKQERDELKNNLFRAQIRYEGQLKAMAKLDKDIEEFVGKAVDMNDLEMLYKLDLETVNAIKGKKEGHLNELANNLAATKIQATYRGNKARNDAKVLKFQKKRIANKLGGIRKQKLEEVRWGAVLLIQRLFREQRRRREYLRALDSKYPKKEDLEIAEEKKKEAARKIMQAWKAMKERVAKGLPSTSFAAAARMMMAKNNTGAAGEPLRLAEKLMCHICKENVAIRRCLGCTDPEQQMYCMQCYKTQHARGARKRHERQRIIYDGQPYDANASVASVKQGET